MTRVEGCIDWDGRQKVVRLGTGVTKATRGQRDFKAIHKREVFTAEKCKRDRPTGGKAHQPPRVFVFELRSHVRIGRQNLFPKCVRIGKHSSQRVFKSRGTTVNTILYSCVCVCVCVCDARCGPATLGSSWLTALPTSCEGALVSTILFSSFLYKNNFYTTKLYLPLSIYETQTLICMRGAQCQLYRIKT